MDKASWSLSEKIFQVWKAQDFEFHIFVKDFFKFLFFPK